MSTDVVRITMHHRVETFFPSLSRSKHIGSRVRSFRLQIRSKEVISIMRTFLKSLWIALAFVGLVYFRFVHDLQGLSNKSSSLPMRNGQFPPHPNPSLLPSNITSQTIPTLKKNHSRTPKVAWLISYPNSVSKKHLLDPI